MHKAIITLFALIAVLTFTACDKAMVYSHYEHVPYEGWNKNEPLQFSIDTLKASDTYAMTLGIRMTGEYPFRNLHMVVEQTVFPSMTVLVDKIKCTTVDKQGNMLGHGVSTYEYNIPLRKHAYNQGDSIHVKIRHDMKRETLPGIIDVGLTLRHD